MTITAFQGPVVSFGQAPFGDQNPEMATSLFWGGVGILDPRSFYTYEPGQGLGNLTAAWLGVNRIVTIDAVPVAKSNTILSSAAHTTSGTPLTLVSSTADGVLVGASITRTDTGTAVTGLLKLDPAVASVTANLTNGSNVLTVTAVGAGGTHGYNRLSVGMTLTDSTTAANIPSGTTITGCITGGGGLGTYTMSANATATATGDTVTAIAKQFPLVVPMGQAGTVCIYNPYDMISRVVSITSTTSQVSGATFTVRGFDWDGIPQTDVITTSGTTATTTVGQKAFKFIQSVTPNTTDGTGFYSVGTTDTIGFPIRSDSFDLVGDFDIALSMNAAAITSATGYTAAVLSTSTATTGDVAGSYALQSASDGTKRLIVQQSPNFANINNGSIGLYGITPFSDF